MWSNARQKQFGTQYVAKVYIWIPRFFTSPPGWEQGRTSSFEFLSVAQMGLPSWAGESKDSGELESQIPRESFQKKSAQSRWKSEHQSKDPKVAAMFLGIFCCKLHFYVFSVCCICFPKTMVTHTYKTRYPCHFLSLHIKLDWYQPWLLASRLSHSIGLFRPADGSETASPLPICQWHSWRFRWDPRILKLQHLFPSFLVEKWLSVKKIFHRSVQWRSRWSFPTGHLFLLKQTGESTPGPMMFCTSVHLKELHREPPQIPAQSPGPQNLDLLGEKFQDCH